MSPGGSYLRGRARPCGHWPLANPASVLGFRLSLVAAPAAAVREFRRRRASGTMRGAEASDSAS